MGKSAVVFLAWGERYTNEVLYCIDHSPTLNQYDLFIITDRISEIEHPNLQVIRVDFQSTGLLRKTELINFLPEGYEVFLFLDSDTVVLEDISLGFNKAAQHGIAVAPAPHYSLDYFFGFGEVMKSENMPISGQLQYNTGVIFFSSEESTESVFRRWRQLAEKYQEVRQNDQPFFSLALEQLGLNPYTLSISYNYRGYGDAISGVVRIWHSHKKMPEDINRFDLVWPPRRAIPGKVIHPKGTQKGDD